MKSWQQFTEELTEAELLLIVADDRELRKAGAVGDCFLRSKAEEWCDINGNSSLVILTMRDLAGYAYEYFANEYFKLVNIEV